MPIETSAAIQIEKWIIRESVMTPETANMPVFVDGSSEIGSHVKLPHHQVIDLQAVPAVSLVYRQTHSMRHSV